MCIIVNRCIAVLFFLLSSCLAIGQFSAKSNHNFFSFKNKAYYLGLSGGINTTKFLVHRSDDFIDNAHIRETNGYGRIGYNLNMISNLKIGQFFDIRFMPGFSFEYKSIMYNDNNFQRNEFVYVEFPFQIRYKSLPYYNKRIFVTTGMKYAYETTRNQKVRDAENVMKISPHDFQWEVGFGIQMFYPYFIFSPELKLSRGLNNVLIHNPASLETSVLDDATSQAITLSFIIEG